MFRRVNNNKFGVIEYAIDSEEDLLDLPREDTNNAVYAILIKDGKKLVYLYSKEIKDYILINGDLEEINVKIENINEQLETIAYNVKLFGISGVGDETVLFNEICNRIADLHGTILVPQDMTIIAREVLITNKSNFSFDIRGTIKRPDNTTDGATINLDGCSNVYFKCLNLDGNVLNNGADETCNKSLVKEGWHCLRLVRCSNIYGDVVNCKNTCGDGVYLNNVNNVNFKTIYVENEMKVGRNALSIIHGENIVINDLFSINVGHREMPGGFNIEPNTSDEYVKNVYINNVYIKSAGICPLAIQSSNNSNVENINIGNVKVITTANTKINGINNVVCTISGKDTVINKITHYNEGGIFPNGIDIQLKDNVTILNSYFDGVNNGINIGYGNVVNNIKIKTIIRNCNGYGVQILNCNNVDLDIDIDTCGTGKYMINQNSSIMSSNVKITGKIPNTNSNTGIAMVSNNANISNWIIKELDLTGWGNDNKVRGAGFVDNLKSINCPNFNYLSQKPAIGCYSKGDIVYNTNITELGTDGSKYIIDKWICITSSDGRSNGVFAENKILTGN